MRSDLPPDALKAVSLSSLKDLPRELLDGLTEGSIISSVAAGKGIHQEGDPPFAELVISGLIRAYVAAPTGRTMTIRYCRPGALMGIGTVFNQGSSFARGNLVALIDSRLLKLRPVTLRALADKDIRVTRALLGETSARVADYINELQLTAFASLRQRLARHLLDLASERQVGRSLVAPASQEELAAAVGTVREVVVRILHDMRAEGLVRTRRGGVEVVDPVRLDAEGHVAIGASELVRPESQ